MRYLVLLCGILSAQTILAELALERRQPRPLRAEYVQADGGLVTVSYKSPTSTRTFALHKYDADFRAEWSQELFDQSSGEELAHLAVVDTQIWVFTQRAEGNRWGVYAYVADLDGRFSRRGVKVLQVDPGSRRFELKLSYAPNRQYVCLSAAIRVPADSADRIAFYLVGPDTSFGGEWILPFRERELEVRRPIQPSHEGHLFALGAVRVPGSEFPQYYLMKYLPETQLTLTVPLEVEGVYLLEPMFRIEKGGGARIAGFYSLRRGSPQVQGLAFAGWKVQAFFCLGCSRPLYPQRCCSAFYPSGKSPAAEVSQTYTWTTLSPAPMAACC